MFYSVRGGGAITSLRPPLNGRNKVKNKMIGKEHFVLVREKTSFKTLQTRFFEWTKVATKNVLYSVFGLVKITSTYDSRDDEGVLGRRRLPMVCC